MIDTAKGTRYNAQIMAELPENVHPEDFVRPQRWYYEGTCALPDLRLWQFSDADEERTESDRMEDGFAMQAMDGDS